MIEGGIVRRLEIFETEKVQTLSVEWEESNPTISSPVSKACEHLLSLQKKDSYWEALFEMDVRQTAEYIFLRHFLGNVDQEEENRMLRHILRKEREEGGWNIFPGGQADISTTVTAYYALRMGGYSPDHPALQRARKVIMQLGGIMKANCFTRGYFHLFKQMHPDSLPAMPVEIMLLPKWFPFNIYAISSWSRAILIPLLIIAALREEFPSLDGPSCEELYPENCNRQKQPINFSEKVFTWHNFFLVANQIAKFYEKHPIRWIRKIALDKAHEWTLRHMGQEGGVAALFPSMVNASIALVYLGYDKNHPLILNELKALEGLKVQDGEYCWIQPCLSTIWDTAWCFHILPQLGLSPSHPAMIRTKEFLLEKQVSVPGDWQEKIPQVPCGGWYFEMENAHYPDTDDTAAVLMGLHPYREEDRVQKAAQKAIQWLFAMQSKEGGFAAFDHQDHVYECFNYIPFAEHGALLDPPTADVTARVVEALSKWGYGLSDRAIYRAVKWLLEKQEKEGCWYGRWGVNYVYGTWAVLCGLKAVGFDMQSDCVKKAVQWLISHQNQDGGWGETCETYKNPSLKGKGESTPSQTAWALLGLHAAGESLHSASYRGVKYLLQTQKQDGSWQEDFFTGTGFPGVCYLRYSLYKDHFPALALARILPEMGSEWYL